VQTAAQLGTAGTSTEQAMATVMRSIDQQACTMAVTDPVLPVVGAVRGADRRGLDGPDDARRGGRWRRGALNLETAVDRSSPLATPHELCD